MCHISFVFVPDFHAQIYGKGLSENDKKDK